LNRCGRDFCQRHHPLPLSGDLFHISFETEGRPVAQGERPSADFFLNRSWLFQDVGIPQIKGRDFTERDDAKLRA